MNKFYLHPNTTANTPFDETFEQKLERFSQLHRDRSTATALHREDPKAYIKMIREKANEKKRQDREDRQKSLDRRKR